MKGNMKPIKRFQIGKGGLSGEFIEHLRNAFKNSELVKVSILKSACRNREEAREMGEKLVKELGPEYKFSLIGYVLVVKKFRKGYARKNGKD